MSEPRTQLEDAIRAQLQGEVRLAPAGAATKASVLQAVAGQPMDHTGRHLRRWLVPMLAAAAVVLVAIGVTALPRVLSSHRVAPAHKPSPVVSTPELPAPKPAVGLTCSTARGETLVNGLHTTYQVSATHETRYVFEYYCAGADGHRTGSSLQVFKLVDGRLQFDQELLRPALGTFVMSLRGGQDAVGSRDASGLAGIGAALSPGAISDGGYLPDAGQGAATAVAQACRPADLTVRIANAQLPTPHLVLQLTNHSKVGCALWGNPRYTPVNGAGVAGNQPVRYVLRGPAGGVNTAPSAPVILLRSGATADASIGTDPHAGNCSPSAAARVTLPNGVDLGLQDLSACNIVSYPLVARSGGDDSADYPTVRQPTAPSSCADGSQLLLGSHPVSTQSGDGAGLVLTVKLVTGPPCTLSGYPDVHAVDSSGTALVTAAHTPNGGVGGLGGLAPGTTSPPTVTLTAGETASALVEWAAAAYSPTSTCHRDGRISLTIGAGGATYEPSIGQLCDLAVHPFVSGDTGSQ